MPDLDQKKVQMYKVYEKTDNETIVSEILNNQYVRL